MPESDSVMKKPSKTRDQNTKQNKNFIRTFHLEKVVGEGLSKAKFSRFAEGCVGLHQVGTHITF
jgi:hypothetical protein